MLVWLKAILAHMEGTGAKQKQMNGGKMLMRAVGMAGKEWQANKKPAEQGTAGRHSRQTLRPAQASKQTATDGRPRSEAMAADKVGLPLAVQCRLMGGVQWCWQPRRRVQTYLAVPTPPIAFACHCPYPLP